MASGNTGFFTPINVNKLIPKRYPLKYKSSWELYFMNFLDRNQNVVNWGYEIIKIPYFNPIKKKKSIYLPDFFIKYRDKNGNEIYELIEIKPTNEIIFEAAKSRNQKLHCIINKFKWEEAKKWCDSKGIIFRIISEKDMFIW